MYFTFLDILDAVGTFMQRGGPVLWVIAWLLLIKWSLVFERIWYLNTTHKTNIKNTLADWNARTDTQSWSAHQIRTMMISKISLDVRNTLPIIEVLVTICPLLGLIGTVTGMIEVFFVMAVSGVVMLSQWPVGYQKPRYQLWLGWLAPYQESLRLII